MRLHSFQVRNYRCVDDSGAVELGDVTVLVGKNESGKTAILRALQKLNPKTPLPFDRLREFPRKRFHEFDEEEYYPVATATFLMDQTEREALARSLPELSGTTSVTVIQDFSGERSFSFAPVDPEGTTLDTCATQVGEITKALASIQAESSTSAFVPIRDQLIRLVEEFFASVPKDKDIGSGIHKRGIRTTCNRLKKLASTASPRPAAVDALVAGFDSLVKKSEEASPRKEAEKVTAGRIPRFIYFDVFQQLENKVQLSAFVSRKKQGSMTKEDVTADTLFTLAGLDVDRLVDLERTDGKTPDQIQRSKDERALLVSRASVGLSGRIADIWKQRHNRVEFYLDGDYLRLWVVDQEGSKLEYEEQSKGFHWFFSFYVIFNVESDREHKDCILLLDEPGLHLHPAAQEDMIRVLRELSKSNQIIYTTHSPFMIDMDHLDTVRLVIQKDKEGTKIQDIGQVIDPDTLFPLQAAIGYSLSQSLFVGKRNFVVEGVTDFWILSAVATLLRDAGEVSLDPAIVITPAGGARKVTYLSSLMTAQKLKVGVLFDSDPEGRSAAEDLLKSKLIRDRNVLFIDEILGKKQDCELEDLLPEQLYVDAVNEVYGEDLAGKGLSTPLSSKLPRITQRVEAALSDRGITFHKSRPARHLLTAFGKMPIDQLPPDLRSNFTRLFELANKRVPQ